jgi:hypothetical protein
MLTIFMSANKERGLFMKEEYRTVGQLHADETLGAPLPVSPAPELDLDKYRAEIADFQITDEQADELLLTLWSIMSAFVEFGFRADDCGQLLGWAAFATGDDQNGVDLQKTPSAPGDAGRPARMKETP